MPIPATTFDYFDNNTRLPWKCERFPVYDGETTIKQFGIEKKEKYKQNKTKLTVNGHLLDHKVLAGERGHDAFKVAGELDSWTDEVNGPVLGQHVVSGRCVTQADVLLHGPDGQRHLAEYPLVRWAGTVEVPCDHQTFGLARAQPVQTVQKHVGAVEHGARHSLVDYHHVVPYGCKQTRAY